MARAYTQTNKIEYVELTNHVEGIMPDGTIFYIDKEDYDFVKSRTWHFTDGYLYSYNLGLLHRELLKEQLKDGFEVDHINKNRVDNRKSNLRVVTRQQNMYNKSKYKTNTSGYAGIKWNKRLDKWQAQITHNKKRIHLGVFDDLQEAIKARRIAEDKFVTLTTL